MENKKDYNKIANKLVEIEDKFLEIKSITKTIDIWARENDYELIPMINLLNNKMQNLEKAISK